MSTADPAVRSNSYVFGYGSLVRSAAVARPAQLSGFRRTWGVAMDNTVTVPGYKYYVSADGDRPALLIAFLDVVQDPMASVNGVILAVNDHDLGALDRRERNYERRDVTSLVPASNGRRTWLYVGSADGRGRFARGQAEGRLAVSGAYYRSVLDDFAALGDRDLAALQAGLGEPPGPILDLRRIDL